MRKATYLMLAALSMAAAAAAQTTVSMPDIPDAQPPVLATAAPQFPGAAAGAAGGSAAPRHAR